MSVELTAQDAYNQLMRHHIAPAIRALGFKGSAGRFWSPDPEYWVGIGFQKDKYSDRSEIRFTINLSVISRAEWAAKRLDWMGERPQANSRYSFGWSNRIGSFLPEHEDYWWTLVPGQDLAALAFDVMTAVEVYGLPGIRGQVPNQ